MIRNLLGLGILISMSIGLGYWYHFSQITAIGAIGAIGIGCGICIAFLGFIAFIFFLDSIF